MENRFQTYEQFIELFNKIKQTNYFNVTEIPFSKLDQWIFTDSLQHISGRFFKIEGISVKTNYGFMNEWD
jgi:oxidase EvaA